LQESGAIILRLDFGQRGHCGPPEKSSRSTPVIIHQSRRQRPAIAINKQDVARFAIHRDAIDGRRAAGQRSESLSASGRDSTPPFLSVPVRVAARSRQLVSFCEATVNISPVPETAIARTL
jgi:hypothetical protein